MRKADVIKCRLPLVAFASIFLIEISPIPFDFRLRCAQLESLAASDLQFKISHKILYFNEGKNRQNIEQPFCFL